MRYSRILGTGSYLPARVVTNQEISERVDTTDEWIIERTGIRARRIADPAETSSSMAYQASREALSAANLSADAISLIVVATSTPDKVFPSTACFLQGKLGITSMIPAFDVSAACAGFSYALSVADQFIRSGMVDTALVVGSELMSRTVDWNDRSMCVLFGDGAGAVLLSASETPGIYSTHIHSDGSLKDILYYQGDRVSSPETGSPYMQMNGKEVFKVAVQRLGELVDESLKANGFKQSDVDWLIPHQANLRIINAIAKRLDLPMERVIVTLEEHGNTSAASIPIALDTAIRTGKIQRGHRLLLESFGGGLAWGAALVQY